jgi:hypothetical protein
VASAVGVQLPPPAPVNASEALAGIECDLRAAPAGKAND